jgi:hypothetical protein
VLVEHGRTEARDDRREPGGAGLDDGARDDVGVNGRTPSAANTRRQ